MKLLQDLIYKAGITEVIGTTSIEISFVCFDNRKAGKNCLFVATIGLHSDGHNFIDSAIDKGAIAIVCEELPIKVREGVTYIKVTNSRIALGFIASNYFGNPSEYLKVIGVTGTNGKTTVATLLFNLFRNLGYNAGLISTVKNQINDEIIFATHTTPDAIQINAMMSQMLKDECTYCFMEVSSHSIDQNRISGIKFTGGIFTNITHDHLDYHKTFSSYLMTKKQFRSEE